MLPVKTIEDFWLDVDGIRISIPISKPLMAHYHEQFKTNTDAQRNRQKTLKELMRAAYRAGKKNSKSN